MDERKVGLKDNLKKMKEMAEEGDEARQNSLTLIIPRTGKSAKKSKLSAPEKAKQKLRISFLRRKAQAKAKAKASPENSVEPEDRWDDSSVLLLLLLLLEMS